MTHRTLFLPIGNDCNLQLSGLLHVLSGTLVTSAAISFTVVLSGTVTTVAGQTWPSSMTLVNTETAFWVGPLINSLALQDGESYHANVTVNGGVGKLAFWRMPIKAVVREE